MSELTARRLIARSTAALYTAALLVLAWLRADTATDDRGSDSTEKAFMVILAITVGTAVSLAAVVYVGTRTAMFK